MNCKEILALLSDYIDDELEEVTGQEIEEHIEECSSSCRAFLNTFKMTVSLYRKTTTQEIPEEVHLHLRHLLWQSSI